MPFLEQADLRRVAEQAEKVSAALLPLIEQAYDIQADKIAYTASDIVPTAGEGVS